MVEHMEQSIATYKVLYLMQLGEEPSLLIVGLTMSIVIGMLSIWRYHIMAGVTGVLQLIIVMDYGLIVIQRKMGLIQSLLIWGTQIQE